MKVMFACLCDYASADVTGKLSACGIWDRITAPGFPASLGRTFLALRVSFEYEDNDRPNQLKVELIDADNHSLAEREVIIEHNRVLPGTFQALNIMLELSETVIAEPGRYTWILTTDGEKAAEVPFDLVQGGRDGPPSEGPLSGSAPQE